MRTPTLNRLRLVCSRRAASVLALLVSPALCLVVLGCAKAQADQRYPAASHVPASQKGWEKPDPGAPLDEAQGGRTARGTPITKRTKECFPAETRNVFSEVDMVATGPGGQLEPYDYSNGHGAIDENGRKAIEGQNTWILWGEGNEAFWGWLQEQGYGLTDFLILLDSRKRYQRFASAGIVNQPGMRPQTNPDRRILGLYLDEADGTAITLKQPPWDINAATGKLEEPPAPPPHGPYPLFKAGDPELYKSVLERLPRDGLDYDVYGYPSGVVGLRLLPNPDFFGDTRAAATARHYWRGRVESNGNAYYEDPRVASDPNLVRPFRVSMSCGFCHVGPHPLNPPADPERPEWANISSTIGNQFWRPSEAFANLTAQNNALYQFLASQQPGTIDTSLVSTDQINNSNTITNIFDVPARLARAQLNPPEDQSPANMLVRTLEDPAGTNPRHTPRVLLDGADSIGVFGALARVFINIGTFPEEWARCHNPIIGFKPQRPFSVATLDRNSVYWNAGTSYRVPYLAAFFTHRSVKSKLPITAPMKLSTAAGGAAVIAAEQGLATEGRKVFLRNCAICHSSKQPPGFQLQFAADWASKGPPAPGAAAAYTLPQTFAEWEQFRRSSAFEDYRTRIEALAANPPDGEDFVLNNFLSTDIRVPITLVGTNSGRAMGTNAMRGQVWDNFSSDTYKELPAVGAVRFYNPWSGETPDAWGNNDEYHPPKGGPGYYRPASLISIWATSPLLHNNTLGIYNGDPSIAGRLRAFDDAIDKLLWKSKRVPGPQDAQGDMRFRRPDLAGKDVGFIYRSTADTSLIFARGFVKPILVGVVGSFWTGVLTFWLWIILALLLVLLAVFGGPRWAGFVYLLIALVVAIVIVITRVDRIYWQFWLVPLLALGVALLIWLVLSTKAPWTWRSLVGLLVGVLLVLAVVLRLFVAGKLVGIDSAAVLAPFPQGMAVNLLWSVNPEAPIGDLLGGVSGLARGLLAIHKGQLQGAEALKAFEREAALPLLKASKCPDFVLDRGHWFAEGLSDDQKKQVKAFLRTL